MSQKSKYKVGDTVFVHCQPRSEDGQKITLEGKISHIRGDMITIANKRNPELHAHRNSMNMWKVDEILLDEGIIEILAALRKDGSYTTMDLVRRRILPQAYYLTYKGLLEETESSNGYSMDSRYALTPKGSEYVHQLLERIKANFSNQT